MKHVKGVSFVKAEIQMPRVISALSAAWDEFAGALRPMTRDERQECKGKAED